MLGSGEDCGVGSCAGSEAGTTDSLAKHMGRDVVRSRLGHIVMVEVDAWGVGSEGSSGVGPNVRAGVEIFAGSVKDMTVWGWAVISTEKAVGCGVGERMVTILIACTFVIELTIPLMGLSPTVIENFQSLTSKTSAVSMTQRNIHLEDSEGFKN